MEAATGISASIDGPRWQMKHHVERTSPKGPGMPFIGTCRLCGMTGLKASAALEDCENVRGLSVEDALIETIAGDAVTSTPLKTGAE